MDNFNGPADQAERERLGRRYSIEGGPGPLETFNNNPVELTAEGMEKLTRLVTLEKKMAGVDENILDVEKHIIDRMKQEGGASNMKLWAEALQTVRVMERREENK